jgi:hypothetical protein
MPIRPPSPAPRTVEGPRRVRCRSNVGDGQDSAARNVIPCHEKTRPRPTGNAHGSIRHGGHHLSDHCSVNAGWTQACISSSAPGTARGLGPPLGRRLTIGSWRCDRSLTSTGGSQEADAATPIHRQSRWHARGRGSRGRRRRAIRHRPAEDPVADVHRLWPGARRTRARGPAAGDGRRGTSGGRFRIEVFPGGQIMPPLDCFDAASHGTIEAFMAGSYY